MTVSLQLVNGKPFHLRSLNTSWENEMHILESLQLYCLSSKLCDCIKNFNFDQMLGKVRSFHLCRRNKMSQ